MPVRPRAPWPPLVLIAAIIALGLLPARANTTVAPTAVSAVTAVAITVSDMPRALRFYREVLDFQLVDEREMHAGPVADLYGLADAGLRIATLRLGAEHIELVAWHAPRGRPMPQDSRSHDGWFQHIAIIVSDMDAAGRGRHRGVLLQGSRWTSAGDSQIPARQGRGAVAARRPAVPRHRPHGDRRARHRREPRLLS
jgi:catechol 2,3-dioxygenase-like lactoylglutathione lyase family enzyme